MVECPSGLRSTPRKRVRFSASESSNLSSTAPWDSKRFLESLFSCGSPPFFRAVAIVQRHSSVLQSIAKGYKRRHWESRLSPPRRRSETVIVRRQEKGDEKHEDRGCGKLEKTERPDSPPTPLQQKRRLDTTRPGRPSRRRSSNRRRRLRVTVKPNMSLRSSNRDWVAPMSMPGAYPRPALARA